MTLYIVPVVRDSLDYIMGENFEPILRLSQLIHLKMWYFVTFECSLIDPVPKSYLHLYNRIITCMCWRWLPLWSEQDWHQCGHGEFYVSFVYLQDLFALKVKHSTHCISWLWVEFIFYCFFSVGLSVFHVSLIFIDNIILSHGDWLMRVRTLILWMISPVIKPFQNELDLAWNIDVWSIQRKNLTE